MLQHFYREILGWFDYEQVYREAVEKAKDGDLFVEIGAFLGKSTAFLGVEVANSEKQIRLDVIDTWTGSHDEPFHRQVVAEHGGSLFDAFKANMERGGVRAHINPVAMDCIEAARRYRDGSVDFCFLDASHAYADVLEHIEVWFPKIRPGGRFAGHDYFWHDGNDGGVLRAVHESFGKESVLKVGSCWVLEKKGEGL